MLLRNLLICCLLLSLPLLVGADGCAIGKGFTPQLRETHQLAVINITENSADVSMFIAIEGIPAGQEITYILPFWCQPHGFSQAEDTAASFRETYVVPAYKKVQRMQRIATRRGSTAISWNAPLIGMGFPALLFSHLLDGAHEKGRATGAASTALTPYATDETPHARAELYRIGTRDLQRLLQQSGLSAKYLKPLQKYRTPYFAVMRLKGLASKAKPGREISGRGIRYHFTHQITGGRYTYPLGTGAAWPQPIPITEVYLTCPEHLAMQVSAPTEGETIQWMLFRGRAHAITDYLESPEQQKRYATDYSAEDMAQFLSPKTSSILNTHVPRTPAWHIAYLQSNPDQDISVQITKQVAPWRFSIADFFAVPGVPLTVCIVLYVIAWFATVRFHIRRRWQRAGSPGSLLRHSLITFFLAQCFAPMIMAGWVILIFGSFAISHPLVLTNLEWIVIACILLFAGSLTTAIVLYARKPATDWRKWLTLTSCLYAVGLYAVMAVLLYGGLYWCEMM